jgi:SAM-dependent methyltransferase
MLEYHRTMLRDERRVAAFREAIQRVVHEGDVVVDVGAGTGVLSFFAGEAGARRVFAIERDHLADIAAFLARQLGVSGRVQVFHEASTEVTLPERADVLLCELIGSAGFDENLLRAVLDARARLLREDAAIVPQRVALHAAPVDVPEAYERHIASWDQPVGGLDFSPLRVFASNALLHLHIDPSDRIADERELIDVNLQTVSSTTVVAPPASFVASRKGEVHGFALWFRATLCEGIEITNELPRASAWAQVFLPLERPLPVEVATPILLSLETEDGRWWRWSGSVGEKRFEQMTVLNQPPCTRG